MESHTAPTPGATLDTWAIVEMFGHKRIAGKLSEHVLGAAALIRCDVPEVQLDQETKSPAYTRYLGVGSIYGITPCSEEVARAAAARIVRYDPPIPLEFQPPAQLAARTSDAEIIDDDDEIDGDGFGPLGTVYEGDDDDDHDDGDDEDADPENPIE